MRAVPRARSAPSDVKPATARPITSVALAFAPKAGKVFRYCAAGAHRVWSGEVESPSVEAAALDVICLLRADNPDLHRTRFLVALPPRSPLWRYADELAVLAPGTSVERPVAADEPLMQCARAAVAACADLAPVSVATDGSVRGTYTGYGWLASTGQYGLQGFRHSTRQVGTKVVLIAELRAIADAVRKLPHRHLTLLSDSRTAVAMVQRWIGGDDILPLGYTTERANGEKAGLVKARELIHDQRDRLTPVWVKGHCGEPLNEGADALARLASRYATRRDGLASTEYRSRAAELAKAFAAEFVRSQAVSA